MKVYQLREETGYGRLHLRYGVYSSIDSILANFPFVALSLRLSNNNTEIVADLGPNGIVIFDIYETEVI